MNKQIFIFFIFLAQNILCQLDPALGMGGVVISREGRSHIHNSVVVQSDNKILTTGSEVTNSATRLIASRYNNDGTYDTAFNVSGMARLLVGSRTEGNSVALQTDNKIVIGGFTVQSQSNFIVVRLTSTGALDTTFNTVGYVTTSIGTGATVNCIKVQADGKIIAAGAAIKGSPQIALVRYNSNGSLDTSFGTGGIVTMAIGISSSGNQLVLQSDNKIVIAGTVFDGAVNQFIVARYNTDGSVDTSFGASSEGYATIPLDSDSYCKSIAIQTDGKIVVGGYSGARNSKIAVARLTSTGGLDTTFNTTGKFTLMVNNSNRANSLVLQPDEKIIVAGSSLGEVSTEFILIRLTTAGILDTLFGDNGITTTKLGTVDSEAAIYSLALQSNGYTVAAGYFDKNGALARYIP